MQDSKADSSKDLLLRSLAELESEQKITRRQLLLAKSDLLSQEPEIQQLLSFSSYPLFKDIVKLYVTNKYYNSEKYNRGGKRTRTTEIGLFKGEAHEPKAYNGQLVKDFCDLADFVLRETLLLTREMVKPQEALSSIVKQIYQIDRLDFFQVKRGTSFAQHFCSTSYQFRTIEDQKTISLLLDAAHPNSVTRVHEELRNEFKYPDLSFSIKAEDAGHTVVLVLSLCSPRCWVSIVGHLGEQVVQRLVFQLMKIVSVFKSFRFQFAELSTQIEEVVTIYTQGLKFASQLMVMAELPLGVKVSPTCKSLENILDSLEETTITSQQKDGLLALYDKLKRVASRLKEASERYLSSYEDPEAVYVFLEGSGKVKFVSGVINERIRNHLFMNSMQLNYTQLFKESVGVKAAIEEALRGEFRSAPVVINMHGFKIELLFFYNNASELEEIIISVSVRKVEAKFMRKLHRKVVHEKSDRSSSVSSGEDSNQDQEFKIHKKNKKMLKMLQINEPGITREGWLSMWMDRGLPSKVVKKSSWSDSGQDETSSLNSYGKELSLVNRTVESEDDVNDINEQAAGLACNTFAINVLDYEGTLQRYALPLKVFRERQFMKKFKIKTNDFVNFLKVLETEYNVHKNSFHNYTHGLNVMLTSHLISQGVALLDDVAQFALVLSSLCHDVGHTGHTNTFEISSGSDLALFYNDRSPLQNFHASKSFQIMSRSQCRILADLQSKKQLYQGFRGRFISAILYTDITQHFPLLNSFATRSKAEDFGKGKDDINLLCGMVIHTADFAGAVKNFEVSRLWSLRVNKEFDAQYKLEKELGIPQTPFFKDLDKPECLAKSEAGFMKIIVRPLYKQINDYFADKFREQLDLLDETIMRWEAIAEGKEAQPKPLLGVRSNSIKEVAEDEN